MHRFFVSPDLLRSSTVHLAGTPYEQIRRVLRMQVGDEIVLFDGSGYEYRVRLVEFCKGQVRGEITDMRLVAGEPKNRVDLYMSLLNKADKLEWALQKCTELGAARFVPVAAARSVTSTSRPERWRRIIQEAAEQSGRGRLPALGEVMALPEALAQAANGHTIVLMPEVGGEDSPAEVLAQLGHASNLAVFIGPEGGFTEEEQSAARACGAHLVSLGPRILRAETAAVAALTLVMERLGEL